MTVGFVLIFRKWVIGEKGTAHKKLQCWRTDGLYLGASKDHCALAIQDQRSIKVQGSRNIKEGRVPGRVANYVGLIR